MRAGLRPSGTKKPPAAETTAHRFHYGITFYRFIYENN